MRSLLIALAGTAAIWLAVVAGLFLAGRRGTAREVAAFLPNLLMLFRSLARDSRVPRSKKLLLLLAIAWIASPIDLVPEFIPIAGPLDDAIVAVFVLRRVMRAAGREIVREHWRGDPMTLERLMRVARVRVATPSALGSPSSHSHLEHSSEPFSAQRWLGGNLATMKRAPPAVLPRTPRTPAAARCRLALTPSARRTRARRS